MRYILTVLMLTLFACGGMKESDVVKLKRDLDLCKRRIEVIEQRQKLVEEMLDEALSKWDMLNKAVEKLEKFSKKSVEVEFHSKVGRAYSEAYLSWYRGRYREAVKRFSSFIASYKDKFLVQQAKLLLADSYYRIGKKRSACSVLISFMKHHKDSPFLCSAYYKALSIGCRGVKLDGRCRR